MGIEQAPTEKGKQAARIEKERGSRGKEGRGPKGFGPC